MSPKLRVSGNQTRATCGNRLLRFTEYELRPDTALAYHNRLINPDEGWCGICAMHDGRRTSTPWCDRLTGICRRDRRKDRKDGYWKEVKK